MNSLVYLQRSRYVPWKAQSCIGLLPTHCAPAKNGDPALHTVMAPDFKPHPLKQYRYDRSSERNVKSAKHQYLIDRLNAPGGYIVRPPAAASEALECNEECVGTPIQAYFVQPNSLTEVPQPGSGQCTQADKARRRVRNKSTVDHNYYTTMGAYLENRCKLYKQRQFNFMDSGNGSAKPGSAPASANVYLANCPGSERDCRPVIYKPSNPSFAVQGAVSSSNRLVKLKYDTVTCNGASFSNAYGKAACAASQYKNTSTYADTPFTVKSITAPLCTYSYRYKPGMNQRIHPACPAR